MTFFSLLHGQKTVKKSLIDHNTSLIQIDADNCYDIEIGTSNSHEIVVEAVIDGEYRNDLLIRIEETGIGILISAGFQPNFMNPNDKLSAHKTVSISLKIQLPKQKNVQVFGTNTNVSLVGIYQDLKVTLDDGRCHLNQVSESAEITTQSGDITISCKGAIVDAKSKYGKVLRDSIPMGNAYFNLSTITGNIMIRKTK
jgi:Toastrack DUF4097